MGRACAWGSLLRAVLPVWKQCECVIPPVRVCVPGAGIPCYRATQRVRVCPLGALSPATVSGRTQPACKVSGLGPCPCDQVCDSPCVWPQ